MTSFSAFRLGVALVALLAAFVLIYAAGCGSERASAPEPDAAVAPSPAPQPGQPAAEVPEPAGGEPPAVAAAPPDKPDGPRLELTQEGVTLTWHERGQLRMDARASSLKADEVTRTGTLLDFSARLYENGRLTAEIRAPRAVADTDKRIVTASGGVTLKSVERATTVRAEWVRWYAREQRVVGNAGVKIESAMGTITAAAFEADTALKTLTVRDSAKGLKL